MDTPTFDDAYTLDNFLLRLKVVLSDLNRGRRLLFGERFRGRIRTAYPEIEANLDIIRSRLSDQDLNFRLEERGLLNESPQLNMKLMGLFESYDEYKSDGGIWRAQRFLKYAKTILGSLGSLIPGAEFIKEFIEALELGIEKAERNSRG